MTIPLYLLLRTITVFCIRRFQSININFLTSKILMMEISNIHVIIQIRKSNQFNWWPNLLNFNLDGSVHINLSLSPDTTPHLRICHGLLVSCLRVWLIGKHPSVTDINDELYSLILCWSTGGPMLEDCKTSASESGFVRTRWTGLERKIGNAKKQNLYARSLAAH